jgi:hypothetical protein
LTGDHDAAIFERGANEPKGYRYIGFGQDGVVFAASPDGGGDATGFAERAHLGDAFVGEQRSLHARRTELGGDALYGATVVTGQDHDLAGEVRDALDRVSGAHVRWIEDGEQCFQTPVHGDEDRSETFAFDVRSVAIGGGDADALVEQ